MYVHGIEDVSSIKCVHAVMYVVPYWGIGLGGWGYAPLGHMHVSFRLHKVASQAVLNH